MLRRKSFRVLLLSNNYRITNTVEISEVFVCLANYDNAFIKFCR